jgi:hypothetical protein
VISVPEMQLSSIFCQDISGLPVDTAAEAKKGIYSSGNLHPDFGGALLSGQFNGIPVNVTSSGTFQTITWSGIYGTDWDPGPYFIPTNPRVEGSTPGNPSVGSGDSHLLTINPSTNMAYELIGAQKSGGGWVADAGAIWNLATSNTELPPAHGSACAYGYMLYAPLLKFDELAQGIGHAVAYNLPKTCNSYNWPADADAETNPSGVPMGQYMRLKASYDISNLKPQSKVIAKAMQKYGCVLIQNGGAQPYLNGVPDTRWDDSDLNDSVFGLKSIPWQTACEFVVVNSVEISPSTAQSNQPPVGPLGIPSNNGSTGSSSISAHHTASGPRAR